MNGRVALVALVTIAFGALTAHALMDVGLRGIFAAVTRDAGAVQVFVDLAIACGLACIWMFFDGRRRELNPWPFIVLTLLAGSFGPLLYLLRREWNRGETTAAA